MVTEPTYIITRIVYSIKCYIKKYTMSQHTQIIIVTAVYII